MGSVSLVVPFSDRWYFAEVIRGATDHVARAGHEVRLHVIAPGAMSTREAVDVIGEDFGRSGTIGAIIGGFKYQPDQGARAAAWERPLVVVGGSVLGFPTVMIDDIGAARDVVQHLQSLGHRRIAHLAGTLTDQMDFSVHSRRAKGYRQVMESAGLEVDIVEADFDEQDALRAAQQILTRPNPPTAIFVVSDEIAFPVLHVAHELGMQPGTDVSIASIDDHPRAEEEGLTTIRQRPAEMGATAAQMLLEGLQSGIGPQRSRLAPITLIKRGSTGRPNLIGSAAPGTRAG